MSGNEHIRGARVATIMKQDLESFGCNFFGKGNEFIEATAPASNEGQPRAGLAKYAVMQGNVANLGKRQVVFFLEISIESGENFAACYHRIGVNQNDG